MTKEERDILAPNNADDQHYSAMLPDHETSPDFENFSGLINSLFQRLNEFMGSIDPLRLESGDFTPDERKKIIDFIKSIGNSIKEYLSSHDTSHLSSTEKDYIKKIKNQLQDIFLVLEKWGFTKDDFIDLDQDKPDDKDDTPKPESGKEEENVDFESWLNGFKEKRKIIAKLIQEFNGSKDEAKLIEEAIFELEESVVDRVLINNLEESDFLNNCEKIIKALRKRFDEIRGSLNERENVEDDYRKSKVFKDLELLSTYLENKILDPNFDPTQLIVDENIVLNERDKNLSAINLLRKRLEAVQKIILTMSDGSGVKSIAEALKREDLLEEISTTVVEPANELLIKMEIRKDQLLDKAFNEWVDNELPGFENLNILLSIIDVDLPEDNSDLPDIKSTLFSSDGVLEKAKIETKVPDDSELSNRKETYLSEIWRRAESVRILIEVRIDLNDLEQECEKIISGVTPVDSLTEIDKLQELLDSLEQLKNSANYFNQDSKYDVVANAWISDINNKYVAAQERINKILNPLLEAKGKIENSAGYRNKQAVKKSVELFLAQRLDNETRKEGQTLAEYLGIIHEKMIGIATVSTLNGLLDLVDDPRTTSYKVNPMAGPAKEFSLNLLGFTYDQSDENRIKSYESFFDQFFNYFDENEYAEVKEFCGSMKEKFREISTWHNRAVVRRNNESAVGPEGALAAIQKLYDSTGYSPNLGALLSNRENATPQELRFVEGVEYSMAIWSAMILKKPQREAIWNSMNPAVQNFFYGPAGDANGRNKYAIKKEYAVVPRYTSTDESRKSMIEKILADLRSMGLSEKESLMAYHIGECYRIGGGIEAFLDASYKNETRGNGGNVGVQAQEGEAKGASIGLYVESAHANTARPDFVAPFGDVLVHGYPPYPVAAQYSHSLPGDPGGFGDGRATLATILSVKDGIKSMTPENWASRSTNPDKVIYQSAVQTIMFLWPSSKISSASEQKYSFFSSPREVPISVNTTLDRPEEWSRVAKEFGYQGETQKALVRAIGKFTLKATSEELEQYGFRSESVPLSGDRKQRLKALYKESRDYWINAFLAESNQYPQDVMRMMQYVFSRDDKNEGAQNGTEYYVNEKIGKMIEAAKTVLPAKREEFVNKKFKPWLQGYFNFDVLMRANFYLFKPDFRNIPDMSSPEKIEKTYNGLDFGSYEDLSVQSVSGGPLLNTAQVMYVINQAKLLLDLIPEETEKIAKSGYKLYDDKRSLNLVAPEDRDAMDYANDEGIEEIFTHADLLRLANGFDLAQGCHYKIQETNLRKEFWQLKRDKGSRPTTQWVVDRIKLLHFLFNKDKLGAKN